jgi:hypothetical protein
MRQIKILRSVPTSPPGHDWIGEQASNLQPSGSEPDAPPCAIPERWAAVAHDPEKCERFSDKIMRQIESLAHECSKGPIVDSLVSVGGFEPPLSTFRGSRGRPSSPTR